MKMEKLSKINFELFCGSNSTRDQPISLYLCNSIPKLLNVIEDPAQRVHTYILHNNMFYIASGSGLRQLR